MNARSFVGEDKVTLGNYDVITKFGCITFCNSPDFNGVDGILGFGMPPKAARNGLPLPLFQAISYVAAVWIEDIQVVMAWQVWTRRAAWPAATARSLVEGAQILVLCNGHLGGAAARRA